MAYIFHLAAPLRRGRCREVPSTPNRLTCKTLITNEKELTLEQNLPHNLMCMTVLIYGIRRFPTDKWTFCLGVKVSEHTGKPWFLVS